MSDVLKKPKVGLALGGGGAKGLAHVGAIKVLKRAGIPIDFIAGTSMGALVGGWYALTEDIEFLEDVFLKIKSRDVFPVKEILKKRDGSLFRGESVAGLLRKYFKEAKFSDCRIPFRAVATDVKNGDEVVLQSGKLIDALLASSALPVIFPPVAAGGRLLLDGGLSNPVPADVVRDMGAEFVIAIDVSSRWINPAGDNADSFKNIFSIFSGAVSVIEYQLAKEIVKKADVVLRPPVLNFNFLGFGAAAEIMDIGRQEAELRLREIRQKSCYPEPPKTGGEKFWDFLFHLDQD